MKFSESWLREIIDLNLSSNELSQKLIDKRFINVEYRNLTNGIAAIHSGWKIE